MSDLLTAAGAIPLAVWAAMLGLAVAIWFGFRAVARALDEDANHDPLTPERRRAIHDSAREWGSKG